MSQNMKRMSMKKVLKSLSLTGFALVALVASSLSSATPASADQSAPATETIHHIMMNRY